MLRKHHKRHLTHAGLVVIVAGILVWASINVQAQQNPSVTLTFSGREMKGLQAIKIVNYPKISKKSIWNGGSGAMDNKYRLPAGVSVVVKPDYSVVGEFINWGEDCASFGANDTCTLVMNGDKEVEMDSKDALKIVPGSFKVQNPAPGYWPITEDDAKSAFKISVRLKNTGTVRRSYVLYSDWFYGKFGGTIKASEEKEVSVIMKGNAREDDGGLILWQPVNNFQFGVCGRRYDPGQNPWVIDCLPEILEGSVEAGVNDLAITDFSLAPGQNPVLKRGQVKSKVIFNVTVKNNSSQATYPEAMITLGYGKSKKFNLQPNGTITLPIEVNGTSVRNYSGQTLNLKALVGHIPVEVNGGKYSINEQVVNIIN
ncbi:MAG: hypothetical protein AAB657_04970 [Patescibacteria group bacterium]